MFGRDPWIKKRVNYLRCIEGKGVKTFTVYCKKCRTIYWSIIKYPLCILYANTKYTTLSVFLKIVLQEFAQNKISILSFFIIFDKHKVLFILCSSNTTGKRSAHLIISLVLVSLANFVNNVSFYEHSPLLYKTISDQRVGTIEK